MSASSETVPAMEQFPIGLSRKGATNLPPGENLTPPLEPKTACAVVLPDPWRLPNYTLGQDAGLMLPLPAGVQVETVTGVDEAGIALQLTVDGVQLMPRMAGDFTLRLMYNGGCQATLLWTVNPDPWSLWQVRQPSDEELIFANDRARRDIDDHRDFVARQLQGMTLLGASRRGRSHEHAGSFRDDDLGVWTDEKRGTVLLLVSDGAGSCRFSREGARRIIRFIMQRVEENKERLEAAWQSESALKPEGAVGMILAQLAVKAREALQQQVTAEAAVYSDWTLKDFSATLLMVAVKREATGGVRLVSFSIGDGAIAWLSAHEGFRLMSRADHGEFDGSTRFLTSPEVWRSVMLPEGKVPWSWQTFCQARVACQYFEPEVARGLQVFLMTDGVSDPWFETECRLHEEARWRRFADEVWRGLGVRSVNVGTEVLLVEKAVRLWQWLGFRIAGNHDDRTLLVLTIDDNTV